MICFSASCVKGEHSPTASPVSNSALPPSAANITQPIVTSIIKTESTTSDPNLNANHYEHQNNDPDDDENDDDQEQNNTINSEIPSR